MSLETELKKLRETLTEINESLGALVKLAGQATPAPATVPPEPPQPTVPVPPSTPQAAAPVPPPPPATPANVNAAPEPIPLAVDYATAQQKAIEVGTKLGSMAPIQQVLAELGATALTELPPEQLGTFVQKCEALVAEGA